MESVEAVKADDLNMPSWAQPFFEKMKADICAEVHAKVSYTMRIMLDNMSEDIKRSLKNPNEDDPKKYRSCKKTLKKEEKKPNKLLHSASNETVKKNARVPNFQSSNEELDGEMMKVKCVKQVPIISLGALKPQSLPKRALHTEQSEKVDESPETLEQKPNISDQLLATRPTHRANVETNPGYSDSEFEVVSHPILPKNYGMNDDTLESDLDISDVESKVDADDDESESQWNFTDCHTMSESKLEKTGNYNTDDDLLKSFSTTSIDDCTSLRSSTGDSTETLDIAVESEALSEALSVLERERHPYSATYNVVTNQPLPSEFERQRKPYNQIPVNHSEQPLAEQTNNPVGGTNNPAAAAGAGAVAARPRRQSGHYHVDNLPESLWEEALTVAAQTYNAAKVAVENLADTFGSSPPSTNQHEAAARVTRIPSGQIRVDPRMVFTDEEQHLIEMGFTNAALNAVLLDRHNHDMDKVIAALIDM